MSFKTLEAYKKGFAVVIDIFEISKAFPKEEAYALTDQIRCTSRSVCANISEAYRNEFTFEIGLVN